MSIEAMRLAWQQGVPSTAKLVLVALCDFADDQGWCWPGKPRIATKCGLTPRSVQKWLAELEKLGLVQIVDRFRDDGSQASNGYFVFPSVFQATGLGDSTRSELGGEGCSPPMELAAPLPARSARRAEQDSSPGRATRSPFNPQQKSSRKPQQQPQPRGAAAVASGLEAQEPSSDAQTLGADEASVDALVFPEVLEPPEWTEAAKILASRPQGERQAILDELAGRSRATRIDNALGYLRGMVKRASCQ